MTGVPKPDFATNRPGERVADALAGFLSGLAGKWAEPPDVAIATAYFNPGGFGLLADALEACGPVRILLGAEPEQRDHLRRRQRARAPLAVPGFGVASAPL